MSLIGNLPPACETPNASQSRQAHRLLKNLTKNLVTLSPPDRIDVLMSRHADGRHGRARTAAAVTPLPV
jgi:hypothetical protein